MVSVHTRLINGVLRLAVKRRLARQPMDRARVEETRRRLARIARRNVLPIGVTVTPAEIGGVPGEWVDGPGPRVPGKTLLYLHGGAYAVGTTEVYRILTWRLADAASCRVFALEYRLVPEHPYPAASDDALAAYRALIDAGHRGEDLALAGDSAGGNLLFVLLQRIRAEGLPMPASVVGLSPWTDLTGSGASATLNARRDPMLPAHRLREAAELYAPDADHRDPLLSPVFADFRGFPPIALHVGSTEILLDDSTRIADQASRVGVPVQLRIWQAQPHVFPILAQLVPEARAAIAEIGRFLLANWLLAADRRCADLAGRIAGENTRRRA